MDGLLKVSGCDNAQRLADVVFVHGLDGDARSTWHPANDPSSFWPGWLGEDLPQVGVWSLGYAVSSSAWKGHSMPLSDRATNTLDLLELDGLGQRPLVFICHSLGGLLIKQALRHARDSKSAAIRAICDQAKLVVFLSTPHSGADMASWMKHIGTLLRATVSVEELEAHHPRLRELNVWYRDHVGDLGIKTFVYCEKLPTQGILVVNETTADPGIAGVTPVPLDEDHISICKPPTRQAQVYRRVKKLIEETLSNPPARAEGKPLAASQPTAAMISGPWLSDRELTCHAGSRETAGGRSYRHALATLLIENAGSETAENCEVICELRTSGENRPLRFPAPWMSALDHGLLEKINLRPGETAYVPILGVEDPFGATAEAFFVMLSDDRSPGGSVTMKAHVTQINGSLTVLANDLRQPARWPFSVEISRPAGTVRVTVGERSVVIPPGDQGMVNVVKGSQAPLATGALATWKDKLSYFREQEAITADPAQKFALKKEIEEAERKIRELQG